MESLSFRKNKPPIEIFDAAVARDNLEKACEGKGMLGKGEETKWAKCPNQIYCSWEDVSTDRLCPTAEFLTSFAIVS